jgi:hypothetical protein
MDCCGTLVDAGEFTLILAATPLATATPTIGQESTFRWDQTIS